MKMVENRRRREGDREGDKGKEEGERMREGMVMLMEEMGRGESI